MSAEPCPFCRTPINPGAVVCTGCGAYEGRSGDGNPVEVILWIAWGIFGPYLAVAALGGKGFLEQYSGLIQFLIGLGVTVVGWIVMKRLFKRRVWRLKR